VPLVSGDVVSLASIFVRILASHDIDVIIEVSYSMKSSSGIHLRFLSDNPRIEVDFKTTTRMFIPTDQINFVLPSLDYL
jgi:hypothetical protein